MFNLSWHDILLAISGLASAWGIILLLKRESLEDHQEIDESDAAEETLLRMAFIYWVVYCSTVVLQKFGGDFPHTYLVTLKLTGMLTYLLTFCCILGLPLHLLEARQQPQSK
ncbi:hypothetical protein GS597_12035 [Synechococcales cyanobacterium C]|uniref:Uncharacterized protein n=1 Tax=Petrachloros mirabilis ULC683 TaxID=2781853 RepID=A0A8K2A7S6_9CYAN|nr:hypothetical protein [Petrachloros mirabilis]NCJ07221.1 hypothetical protein [Petrachloros mirabilis ULC683]